MDFLARIRAKILESDEPPREVLAATDLAEAERQLGFRLPAELSALYTTVADGAFGPGYGLLPMLDAKATAAGGGPSPHNSPLVRDYLERTSTDGWGWPWPRQVVAFCFFGCTTYACIDCRDPQGPIYSVDGGSDTLDASFAKTHSSLTGWLSDWLAGADMGALMWEPDPDRDRTGINPFTKQPMVFPGRRLRDIDEPSKRPGRLTGRYVRRGE